MAIESSRVPRRAMEWLRAAALAALALCLGCASGDGSAATVQADTLPGGTVVVRNLAPSGWTRAESGWRAVQRAVFGGEEGTAGELISPGSIALDALGRVFVADRGPAVIKVYDPRGQFLRSIGREGSGPGEFRVAYIAIRGELLVVHDPRTSRTSVFDTSGTFLRSWVSRCCFYGPIAVDRESRVWIPSAEVAPGASYTWVRYGLDGTPLDTVAVPMMQGQTTKFWKVGTTQVIRMITTVPLQPWLVAVPEPAGTLLIGWTGEFRLRRSRDGRDSTLVFSREWQPVPASDQLRRDTVEALVRAYSRGDDPAPYREAFHVEDVPRTFPAFAEVTADADGNVWVRHGALQERAVRFSVFSANGTWLGDVDFPVTSWGPAAWGHSQVAVLSSSDSGKPTVTVFDVEHQGRKR